MKAQQQFVVKTVAFVLIIASSSVSQCTNDMPMVVTGTATCFGRPLPNSKVSLNHVIGFVLNQIGATSTDANGHFSISGNALDTTRNSPSNGLLLAGVIQFVFEFEYFEPGNNRRTFGVGQWESRGIEGFQGTIHLGNVKADSDSCRRYMLFNDVLQDYKRRGGTQEIEFFVLAEQQITSKSPFAYMTNINKPKGFKMTAEIAKHEYGHILRNYFDGDLAHFLRDIEAYGGFEYHSCDTKTSLPFAFNEGWASYWAGECLASGGNGSKDIEGSVASAIRGLQSRCGSEDKQMLDVLARKPRTIHTYGEFEEAHKKLCTAVLKNCWLLNSIKVNTSPLLWALSKPTGVAMELDTYVFVHRERESLTKQG